jgi:hypothetical protein
MAGGDVLTHADRAHTNSRTRARRDTPLDLRTSLWFTSGAVIYIGIDDTDIIGSGTNQLAR